MHTKPPISDLGLCVQGARLHLANVQESLQAVLEVSDLVELQVRPSAAPDP